MNTGDGIRLLIDILGFWAVVRGLRLTKKTIDSQKKADLANCIADYNFNFLSSPELNFVERILETCFEFYKENETLSEAELKVSFYRIFEQAKIIKNEDGIYVRNRDEEADQCLNKNYQKVVNYLVYLEGFSALINRNVVDLDDVDDLFGYRFFIAVNNPVIQEFELNEYSDYYRGIFKAYVKWFRYRQEKYKRQDIPFQTIFPLRDK